MDWKILSYHPDETRTRLTREQIVRVLEEATTNEPSVVAKESQRATAVSPDLDITARDNLRSDHENEFVGNWVAVEGDVDWINWLDFRREQIGPVSTDVYLFADVDSSATEGWSGYALKFIPSIYSDAVIAVPDTNDSNDLIEHTFSSLTYSARMTHDNKLVVRIAVFSNGAYWEPFYEREVVLARPTGYQLQLHLLARRGAGKIPR